MSITGELRAFAYELGGGRDELLDIADRIEADHESMLADARKTVYQGYVELPKDADGIPINLGEVMKWFGDVFTVRELSLTGNGWVTWNSRCGQVHVEMLTHYHEPTVDELLDQLEGLRGNGSDYEDVVTRASDIAKKLRELLKEHA